MRLRSILAVAVVLLLALPATATAENPKTWRVTIDNLTGPPVASFGQPMSAPLVAVHSNQADMWSLGEPASVAIRYIAEGGSPQFGLAMLTGQPGFLSLAMMLGLTNDGFTGLDSVPLHGKGGVYYTSGYDAGTERNNETFAFLPNLSLVFFVRDPENGVITHHPGIRGGGALIPAAHGWSDPVARVTVERLK